MSRTRAVSEEQRRKNSEIGGDAARLLSAIWIDAATTQTQLKEAIAEEMQITPETVGRWANGAVAVPKERREHLLDCLRAFRWRIDGDWKAATAFSEMLGIDGRDFAEVRKYAFAGEYTHYRIVRFDGSGKSAIGSVTVENRKDKPIMWDYSYEAVGSAGEKSVRTFRGPILKSGKSMYALLAGGTRGKEKYLRVESIWPKANPEDDVTFGVSLSTYIDRGTPMSSPFALISEQFFCRSFEQDDSALDRLRDRLLQMSRNGIIAPFT